MTCNDAAALSCCLLGAAHLAGALFKLAYLTCDVNAILFCYPPDLVHRSRSVAETGEPVSALLRRGGLSMHWLMI